MREDDIDERYVGWFADNIVTQFLEARDLSVQDCRKFWRDGIQSGEHFMYAICLNGEDRALGTVKIGPINLKHRTSDLVTLIGERSMWGKGIASEAITLGSRIAFEVYGIRKLWGSIYADNIGSIKAYTRGGWVIEARMKGQFLREGQPMDEIIVSCFNPAIFPDRPSGIEAPPR